MQEISEKKCIRLDMTGWERYSKEIFQDIKIWPYEQVVYAHTNIG